MPHDALALREPQPPAARALHPHEALAASGYVAAGEVAAEEGPRRLKRPAFQFYPRDWQSNTELRACSVGARGLWIEMMCVMHQAEPYGYLLLKGKPIDVAPLGRLIGATTADVKRWLGELEAAGVLSRDELGIFSRRMVKDERLRQVRAAGGSAGAEHGIKGAKHGSKGGRPAGGTGVMEPPLKPPPAFASASTSENLSSAVPQPAHAGQPADRAEPPEGEIPDQTPAVEMAIRLRKLGVPVQAANPTLQAWITDGFTLRQVLEAQEIAQQRKSGEAVPPNYLDAILRNPPKRAVPPWWTTPERMAAKAAELGIGGARSGEETPAFKARIEDAIAARKQAA